MTGTATREFPSAIPPTEAELDGWRVLSREEQLARYQAALQAPDAGRVSKASMADVLIEARRRVARRRG